MSVPHRCTRFVGPDGALALAAGRVILVEPSSDCAATDPPVRLVAIDPRRPEQRRVLATAHGLTVRAEGEVVAWSDGRRRRIVIAHLDTGTTRQLTSRAGAFRAFDVQGDGTAVAVSQRALVISRPGRRPRNLALGGGDLVRIAQNRIAGFRAGRFFVVNLSGASRRAPGEAPDMTFDFDGRRATWARIRVLQRPIVCPLGPEPSRCTPSAGRSEITIRAATVAR